MRTNGGDRLLCDILYKFVMLVSVSTWGSTTTVLKFNVTVVFSVLKKSFALSTDNIKQMYHSQQETPLLNINIPPY